MDIKNIDRYKTFGFRQEWLELYLEDPAAFWENDAYYPDTRCLGRLNSNYMV